MSLILALPAIYSAVQTEIATNLSAATIVYGFGPREVARSISGANRIVFVPGDPNGSIGGYAPAKSPGANPRAIATLNEQCTVHVWGYDSTGPEDEIKQYIATRKLHDLVYLALYNVITRDMKSLFAAASPTWIRSDIERSYGAEIQFVFAWQSLIPDSVDNEQIVAPAMTGHMIFPSGSVDPNT